LHSKPAAATHWSTRTLAEHLGLSATTIRRVWRRNGIKPHLTRTFKLSRDPRFEDKAAGRRGVVPGPTGTRAGAQLRREEPDPGTEPHAAGPPMKRGRAGTFTHDYKRNALPLCSRH
jgi:hypothetical protein